MIPILIPVGIAGAGGVYYLYKHSASFQALLGKIPGLQSLGITLPNGMLGKVVVPITMRTPVSGQSIVPIAPTNQTGKAKTIIVGLAAKAAGQVSGPSVVNPTQPVVITPGGASNFRVVTLQDVQKALNTLGYANPPLTVNGNLGPTTISAINAFESAHNIPVDGSNSATLDFMLELALLQLASGTAPIGQTPTVLNAKAPPPQINTVQDLQNALNTLGASPQLVVDGISGPTTVAAITAFQIAHGLIADGIDGPQTKTAIIMALSQMQSSQI